VVIVVSDIVGAMNSDTLLCGCFVLYPSYVASILTSVKGIAFYVVRTEKPNYGHYIQQCVEGRNYTIRYTVNNLLMIILTIMNLFLFRLRHELCIQNFHPH
jgi:hypothetical protein